ncbi:low affinity immunoglobulin gamma Fc region receptor II-like [Gouania willdenowi]|uniref:low affinity immunoglobulin gamma Fc region receptor II-like n=1 Tax=Gouania willdenowi TaxID=441366 RepID=UPI0010558A50|nr:low affinity immunoglobulin gamma Fc region receptor II-like [Gouania willdenowi]
MQLAPPLCLLMACLQVNPDRSQFFRYQSFSLSCWDPFNSSHWKVKRRTQGGVVTPCSSPSGPTCVIRKSYESDSGVYWCESGDGRQSNSVNISITDDPVLLEVPVLPLSQGSSVTLGCRTKTHADNNRFDFYQNNHLVFSGSVGEWTIRNVSRSHQGLYSCAVSGGRTSATSPLTVDAASEPTPRHCSVFTFRMLSHLIVGAPYLISTVLLALVVRDGNRNTAAGVVTGRSQRVVTHTVV